MMVLDHSGVPAVVLVVEDEMLLRMRAVGHEMLVSMFAAILSYARAGFHHLLRKRA